jgi:hypothetical protein
MEGKRLKEGESGEGGRPRATTTWGTLDGAVEGAGQHLQRLHALHDVRVQGGQVHLGDGHVVDRQGATHGVLGCLGVVAVGVQGAQALVQGLGEEGREGRHETAQGQQDLASHTQTTHKV